MDQLSHPYLTAGRTIALSIGTFAGKVMPFLFNTFWFYHNFPCKEQACFNILAAAAAAAAVTLRGDYSNELFLPAHRTPRACRLRPVRPAPPRPRRAVPPRQLRPEARPPTP